MAKKEDSTKSSKIDEEELERLAVEALLQEAKRGKSRSEQVGAMGWKKCELHKTNKRFLGNLVLSAVASNRKSTPSNSGAKEGRDKSTHDRGKRSSGEYEADNHHRRKRERRDVTPEGEWREGVKRIKDSKRK